MDNYEEFQKVQLKKWEDSCLCCGACCGSVEGDPCLHLSKLPNGKFYCDIYDKRFGIRKTKSGKTFRCVEIRDIMNKSWPGSQACIYKMK